MINIGDNLNYQGEKFNFDRDCFKTLAEMKDFPEAGVPDGFSTYCLETEKLYRIKKSNTVDSGTGKWREISNNDIQDISEDDLDKTIIPNIYRVKYKGYGSINATLIVSDSNGDSFYQFLIRDDSLQTRYSSGNDIRWSQWKVFYINPDYLVNDIKFGDNKYYIDNGTINLSNVISDSLESTSISNALSANKGKVLADSITYINNYIRMVQKPIKSFNDYVDVRNNFAWGPHAIEPENLNYRHKVYTDTGMYLGELMGGGESYIMVTQANANGDIMEGVLEKDDGTGNVRFSGWVVLDKEVVQGAPNNEVLKITINNLKWSN